MEHSWLYIFYRFNFYLIHKYSLHLFSLLKIIMRLSCKQAFYIRNSHILLWFCLAMHDTVTISFVKNNFVKDAAREARYRPICPEKRVYLRHPAGKVPRVRGYGRWDRQEGDVGRRVWESSWNFARRARKTSSSTSVRKEKNSH